MATVKERILEFIDYKGLSNRKFCEKLEVASNTFSSKSSLGSEILVKIYREYPELNLDWALTGRGSMKYEGRVEQLPMVAEEQETYLRQIVRDELQKVHLLPAQNHK